MSATVFLWLLLVWPVGVPASAERTFADVFATAADCEAGFKVTAAKVSAEDHSLAHSCQRVSTGEVT